MFQTEMGTHQSVDFKEMYTEFDNGELTEFLNSAYVRHLFGGGVTQNLGQNVVDLLEKKDFDKIWQSSFLKFHNLERDIERLSRVGKSINKMAEELELIAGNFSKLLWEYGFGKNTFFRNVSLRAGQRIKIVNGALDGVSFDDRWRMEELAESYQRFIDRMSGDSRYVDELKYRDDSEKELLEIIRLECRKLFEQLDQGRAADQVEEIVMMSVSPAPKASAYTRAAGFKTGAFKNLSHWRIYRLNIVDAQTIDIEASTVFTYRNRIVLRRLMQQMVDAKSEYASKVALLPLNPSDRRILETPFRAKLAEQSLAAMTRRVDDFLNTQENLMDWVFFPSQLATIAHRKERLESEQVAKNIENYLMQKYILPYVKMIVIYGERVDRAALRKILIGFFLESIKLSGEEIVRKQERFFGKKLSGSKREQLLQKTERKLIERATSGNCNIAISAKKFNIVRKEDGSLEVVEEENEKSEPCIIRCLNKWWDEVRNVITSCGWSTKTSKNSIYHKCPECGWFPGKLFDLDLKRRYEDNLPVVRSIADKRNHDFELESAIKADNFDVKYPAYDEKLNTDIILRIISDGLKDTRGLMVLSYKPGDIIKAARNLNPQHRVLVMARLNAAGFSS